MVGKNNQIDMLHGGLLKKILIFALPLAATSILQQLFNSADSAVVGHFAGSEALAAVGSTAPLINIIVNLFIGLSIGANVVIANFIGQGREERINGAVHTAVILAGISGICVMVIGIVMAKPLLIWTDSPENVIGLSTEYLRIFFLGMPFMMIYNFGSSILRSKGDTKRPLYALSFAGVINVGLNLLFVIVFQMSVAGVALATVISNIISSAIILRILFREEEPYRVKLSQLSIDGSIFMLMFKIGMPAGLQGVVFSFSNTVIQTAINGFGSDAVAGSAAAVNFEYIVYFIINAFAQTATTFTSQNFGARNAERCRKVYLRCMVISVFATLLVDFGFYFTKAAVVGLFTTEASVLPYAYIRMQRVLLFQAMANSYEISAATMRGMGHSMMPTLITVLGSCGFRILWIYTVFQKFTTFEMLMNVYPVSWLITGTAVVTAYYVVRKKEFKKFER